MFLGDLYASHYEPIADAFILLQISAEALLLKVLERFASLYWQNNGCVAGQKVFCLLIDLFLLRLAGYWLHVDRCC